MKWKFYQLSCLANVSFILAAVVLIVYIAGNDVGLWILWVLGIAAVCTSKNVIGFNRYKLMLLREIPSDLATAVFYFLWFGNLIITLLIFIAMLIALRGDDFRGFFQQPWPAQLFMLGSFAIAVSFAGALYGDILLERRLTAIEREINGLMDHQN